MKTRIPRTLKFYKVYSQKIKNIVALYIRTDGKMKFTKKGKRPLFQEYHEIEKDKVITYISTETNSINSNNIVEMFPVLTKKQAGALKYWHGKKASTQEVI